MAESGLYKMKLYRYPPESGLALTAVASQGDEIPNGTAYLPGEVIQPINARYKVGENIVTKTVAKDAAYVEFDVEFEAGHNELQTWIATADGEERGAYYVTLEWIE